MEAMIAQIIEAQTAQLAKPARAMVNAECSFVKERLTKAGYTDAAKLYWDWVTTYRNKITDPTVIALEAQLKQCNSAIPSWGISGT